MSKVVVLRRGLERDDGTVFYSTQATHGDKPAIDIQVKELSDAERRDLARDPAVVALPEAMPIRLITPMVQPAGFGGPPAGVEAAAAHAPGPTWGIKAVGADRSKRTGKGVKIAVL